MTIPLVTMLGLFAYAAITSVRNYENLDRAPNLIRATSEQTTNFVTFIQQERRDAMVYLSTPASKSGAERVEFVADADQTEIGAHAFDQAMTSPQVKSVEDAPEAAAIAKMIGAVNGLDAVRQAVEARKISAFEAFEAYTSVIMDEPTLFAAEAKSIINGTVATQGLGLIATVNQREEVSEQDAIMAGALESQALTPQERVAFDEAAGREQDDTALYEQLLNPAELAAFNSQVQQPATVTADDAIAQVQQGVEAGSTIPEITANGLTTEGWQGYTATVMNANNTGGLSAADVLLDVAQGLASTAKTEVALTGSIGAAGLILTLVISILLARSVNRRLKILRTSAAALATEQLPSVVARLRRGETVDVAAEAPSLQVGSDEIGQVGQAIDLVRQTAIRSAVEESRLRHGVNDMFRNLARRNQSLLQRQLTLLDGMERRATDPDVLDDLFKMDHLTTRMRRHAEGLIILSGAAPGRSWSNPVKLIDVMRGAVSEVEDFARVSVSTQSAAMLSGNAVTDVIHLLAELIENATSLSPPFTQVRVSGESVSNGFAIEIEDRGLGLTPSRIAELNERLANPPDVNPANTEQLGLFVVAQLARRHGITVMLRPSPYGGTTAVTLIPQRLISDDSRPARRSGPTAIGAGSGAPTPISASAAPANGIPANGGRGPGDGYPGATAAGGDAPFPKRRSQKRRPGSGPRPMGTPLTPAAPTPTAGVRPAPGPATHGTPPDLDNIPLSSPFGTQQPPLPARPVAQQPAADIPVVTGVPVSRSTSQQPSDYFTRPSAYGNGSSAYGNGSSAYGNGSAGYGGSGAAYGTSGADYGTGNSASGNDGSAVTPAGGNNGDGTGSYGNSSSGGDAGDLPKRVRQANLAPQLRASRTAGGTGAAVPQAVPPDPADVRNTFSAMQRGWQQGRSQQNPDTEDNK